MASLALKAKTDARFKLSGPSYLLGAVFEAEIGLIIPDRTPKKLVYRDEKKMKKKDGKVPR